MTELKQQPKGRKRIYAEYEELLESLKGKVTDRPAYRGGIGISSGVRGATAWLKIRLPHGAVYRGRSYKAKGYLEIKAGRLDSFTWEQLEDLFRLYQGKAERGEPLEETQDITFADYVEVWLEYAKGRIEGQNYHNLKRDIKNRLTPFFGRKGLRIITSADINLWQAKQRETISIASIKRNKNNLSSILNRALKDRLIDSNPCAISDKVRVPDSEPRYINPTELRLLMNNANQVNSWFQDYLLWCFHSGMRQGEIRKLKWSHVFIPDIGVPYLTFRTGKNW